MAGERLPIVAAGYLHRRARTDYEQDRCGCWPSGAAVIHQEGCHPARPRCRWMRLVQLQKYGVCSCPAYPFPHRRNSGACGHPERMADQVWGSEPELLEAVPF